MKRLIFCALLVPSFALAQAPAAEPAKAPAEPAAKKAPPAKTPAVDAEKAPAAFTLEGIQTTSGISEKMPMDDKTSFSTGEKVWLWLKLKPVDENPTLTLRWSKDGEHVWTMDPRPVLLGRTWYYKTVDYPGEWKVELVDNNDNVLDTKTVTVTGEPTRTAAAPATTTTTTTAGTAAKPAETLAESTHFDVVECKLAESIEERKPVSPTTTFTAGSKVYTWLQLNVKEPETQVKLRWYLNDAEVYTSSPVTVKESPAWRTWMYKTVRDAGNWKVEILDAEDKAVFAENFTVQ